LSTIITKLNIVLTATHENVAPVQEGGVGLLLFGPLIENLDMAQSGNDESGLGRWSRYKVMVSKQE